MTGINEEARALALGLIRERINPKTEPWLYAKDNVLASFVDYLAESDVIAYNPELEPRYVHVDVRPVSHVLSEWVMLRATFIKANVPGWAIFAHSFLYRLRLTEQERLKAKEAYNMQRAFNALEMDKLDHAQVHQILGRLSSYILACTVIPDQESDLDGRIVTALFVTFKTDVALVFALEGYKEKDLGSEVIKAGARSSKWARRRSKKPPKPRVEIKSNSKALYEFDIKPVFENSKFTGRVTISRKQINADHFEVECCRITTVIDTELGGSYD